MVIGGGESSRCNKESKCSGKRTKGKKGEKV